MEYLTMKHHETPSNCVANISWISDPSHNKVKLTQRQFKETEHQEEQKAQTSIPCHPSRYANTSLSVSQMATWEVL